MLACWVSHLHEKARLWWRNLEVPHSSFDSSSSQLCMLRLVVAACRIETGLCKWTAHLLKTLAFTWGKKYFMYIFGTTGFCVFQYKLLLSYQRNTWISLINKVRNARCMLELPHVLLDSFLLVHFQHFLTDGASSMQICYTFNIFGSSCSGAKRWVVWLAGHPEF